MKRTIYITLMLAASIWGWPNLHAQGLNISRPDGIGFLLVGTRQDASQIHSSGLGLGAEMFLNYSVNPRLSLSFGAGFLTATDDILRMENQKTIFFPSLEMRVRYNIIQDAQFQPFLYSGFQYYSTALRTSLGQQVGGQSHQGNILAGLGFEYTFPSESHSFYIGGDFRYACFSRADPKQQYWVVKAGLCFKLGHEMFASTRSEESQIPDDLFADVTTNINTEERGQNSDGEDRLSDYVEMIMRMDRLESNIQRNLQNIREISDRIDLNMDRLDNLSSNHSVESGVTKNVPSFMDTYKRGLETYKRGDYQQAKIIFEGLQERYPEHDLASNCYYWIGESYHALGQYHDAILVLNKVFEYDNSYKYDDALLMKGQCYLRLGQMELAFDSFRELLDRYPDSEYVTRARNFLGKG